MATIEDMASVVNNVYHNSGEMADRILKRSSRRFSSVIMDLLYQAMRDAENDGQAFNGVDEEKSYIYWDVGDYLVSLITYNRVLSVEMLTEDMMYDLIIEEA